MPAEAPGAQARTCLSLPDESDGRLRIPQEWHLRQLFTKLGIISRRDSPKRCRKRARAPSPHGLTLTRPSYLDDLPRAAEAFEFTAERHAGQVRAGDAAPFLLHPLEVGALLHVFGYPEHVVTAGLLHDILESSDTTGIELRMRFGVPIARLVEAVSEDPTVDDRVGADDDAVLNHHAPGSAEVVVLHGR